MNPNQMSYMNTLAEAFTIKQTKSDLERECEYICTVCTVFYNICVHILYVRAELESVSGLFIEEMK